MSAPDENRSVIEAEALRPRLRDRLHFSIQEQGAEPVCVIEDRQAWRFHRVGIGEYRFIRALDGTRTVASILAQLARHSAGDSFTEGEALQMLRWLKDNHLLAVESGRPGTERDSAERTLLAAVAWLNPLIVRIPLARPDRFFTSAEAALRWLLGGFGFCIWLAVVTTGGAFVALNWPRFSRDFDGILARDNWLWLLAAWTVLKIIHEFSHGLFCKHFGAAVREIGVMLMLFVPMGYVDATASLGLASKWHRMAVSAAGIYAEFFVAGLAAIVWAHSGEGQVATVAHNVVVTGTVVTLLFNANPLMRFDGYFILSDLFGIPNLATRGRGWIRDAASWLLLANRAARPAPLRSAEDWFVAIYGAVSSCWQVLVFGGLLAGASVALHGGGLLLAVVAAVGWFAVPFWRLIKSLDQIKGAPAGRWFAASWRIALLLALIAAALFVPFRPSISSPAVVELADTTTLRAECPGFVKAVHVRDGASVEAGQLLVEMQNDDAASELERSRLELAQQELRARIAYTHHELAAFEAEQSKAESLRKTVANRESYLATLQIRAPFAGRITGRKLDQPPGAYLQAGDEIAQLGHAAACDVRIAVSQEAEPHFRDAAGSHLNVLITGRTQPVDATLTRVESRATRELINPALTAMAGGPLALQRAEQSESTKGNETTSAPAYELTEPHFIALARLSATDAFVGQLAHVKLHSTHVENLWEAAQSALACWLKRYTARVD